MSNPQSESPRNPAAESLNPKLGMFPLILAVLTKDHNRGGGYYNPYEGPGNIPTLNFLILALSPKHFENPGSLQRHPINPKP